MQQNAPFLSTTKIFLELGIDPSLNTLLWHWTLDVFGRLTDPLTFLKHGYAYVWKSETPPDKALTSPRLPHKITVCVLIITD